MTKEEYWQEYDSRILCEFFPLDFDIWWDSEKFNWKNSWLLVKLFSYKFDIWWNPDKFVWIHHHKNKYINNTNEYINNTNNICKYLLYKITIWYTSRKTNTDILTKYINDLEWNYD